MRLGAIVVIAAKEHSPVETPTGSGVHAGKSLLHEPLAYVDVGGLSLLERMIDRFLQAGVEAVSILVETGNSTPLLRNRREVVGIQVVDGLSSAIAHKLLQYSREGIEHAFINSADAYAETDLLDLFYFHRESRQASTRAFDGRGPLDMWVADCAKADVAGVGNFAKQSERSSISYFVRGYVSRLGQPHDLRQFATDLLCGGCERGPSGNEIRPRVWIGEGAEVHRRARVVAPAYIGSGSRVQEDALVTRSSNIERDCFIDSGTVIENSSILPHTHIGIWLDVCNAMVRENKFMSLERGVAITISDSRVVRSTVKDRGNEAGISRPNLCQKSAIDFQTEPSLREFWQFGTNLFQE